MTERTPGLGGRWRGYEERHVFDGRLLLLLRRLAPRGPRPAEVDLRPPTVPDSRTSVSVIIPCYNYGRFLAAAVGSALDQPGVRVEVLIVDDCSTDDSREVARGLVARHPEVHLLVNAVNSGHVRSFNRGWEASEGELVVKLDADDLLTRGSLSRAAALFERHPEVGLVYGHPRHFSSELPPEGRLGAVRWTVWRGSDWLAERCRLGVSAITNPEMVLRSSVLADLGPMDPGVPYAPDMEISLRVATASDVGHVRGADQALHREHPASMSETDGGGTIVDLRARAAAFERALAALPASSPNLVGLARRALAEDALRLAGAAADRTPPASSVPELLEFAAGICPECTEWSSFGRLARSAPPGTGSRLLRKLARRLRHEVYFARWLVNGV